MKLHAWQFIVAIAFVATAAGAAGRVTANQSAVVTAAPRNDACGDASAAQVRTTLYFGTTRPTGAVSDLEWQIFLRDEVTRRFPEGLTAWKAQGQWRDPKGTISQERAKVLLLVHANTPKARASVQEVIDKYRQQFEQQSVLWETASVCTAM